MYHSKVLTARVDIKTKARKRSSEKHLSFSEKDNNMITDLMPDFDTSCLSLFDRERQLACGDLACDSRVLL